jgi:hypothetical protein
MSEHLGARDKAGAEALIVLEGLKGAEDRGAIADMRSARQCYQRRDRLSCCVLHGEQYGQTSMVETSILKEGRRMLLA